MNKTTATFSVVVFAAVMVGGSLLPAMAAEKTTFSDNIIIDQVYSETPCGNFDTQATGFVATDTTIWDNGHVLIVFNHQLSLHDLDGNFVGHVQAIQVITETTDGLPAVFTLQGTVTCVSTGLNLGIHTGFTVDENGKLHIHSMF